MNIKHKFDMYNFELTKIDALNCPIEELQNEIERLRLLKEEYTSREQAVKVFLNSCYGALASPWFEGFNIDIAEAITLQSQNIAKFASKIINEYFTTKWHDDVELHKKLDLTYANSLPNLLTTIYTDTDSCEKSSVINTSNGLKTIEQWYIENEKNGSAGNTLTGHESVKTDDKILNWSKSDNLYYAPVKRIIRHKVSKAKWKLKTKSGKEVIVTNDHSLIVFRNNKQIEIKPKDYLIGDKVICIK